MKTHYSMSALFAVALMISVGNVLPVFAQSQVQSPFLNHPLSHFSGVGRPLSNGNDASHVIAASLSAEKMGDVAGCDYFL
jgi:hypothetical protein